MKPTVFYKYTTASTAEIILKTGKLRWSNPTLFNDLAEFQRMPRFEPTVGESFRLLPKVLLDAANGRWSFDDARLSPTIHMLLKAISQGMTEAELMNAFSRIEQSNADEIIEETLRSHFEALKGARVLCLTSSFQNEVMWGTYADNHTSCALGFKASLEDSPFHEARPVTYTEKPAVVGSGLDFLLYGGSQELRQKTIEAVCYSKKSAWSYEQEWRLITWRPNEADATYGDYVFYPEELDSVTFGARANPEFIKAICEVTRRQYPAVSLFRMTHQNGELNRIGIA